MRPKQILLVWNSHFVGQEEYSLEGKFSTDEIKAQARILLFFLYCCIPWTVIHEFLRMIDADIEKYTAVAEKEFHDVL